MARVTGPLMSVDASGAVASTIVFAKWRGRNYVRRFAIPSNPRSQLQLSMRAIMKFLAQQWAALSDGDQASWEAGADSLKISPFNHFAGINSRNWKDEYGPSKAYPALRADDAPVVGATTATAHGRQVAGSTVITTANDAWGIALMRASGAPSSVYNYMVVKILPIAASPITWTDGPLPVGDYYYAAFGITEEGVRSVAGASSAVVTIL